MSQKQSDTLADTPTRQIPGWLIYKQSPELRQFKREQARNKRLLKVHNK